MESRGGICFIHQLFHRDAGELRYQSLRLNKGQFCLEKARHFDFGKLLQITTREKLMSMYSFTPCTRYYCLVTD